MKKEPFKKGDIIYFSYERSQANPPLTNDPGHGDDILSIILQPEKVSETLDKDFCKVLDYGKGTHKVFIERQGLIEFMDCEAWSKI